MSNERLYGAADAPEDRPLGTDLWEVVLDHLDGLPGYETWGDCLDRYPWPMRVIVHRRAQPPSAEAVAERVLDHVLDWLDEEYGDPDPYSDKIDATPAMLEAARTFARVLLSEYLVWACEPTGEIIEVSREDAVALLGEGGETWPTT